MNIRLSDHRFTFSIALLLSISAIGLVIYTKPIPQARTPYSYNLELNLPGTTNRRQTLQREVEFYQTKVQQDPQSGLNLAALANAYWKLGKATGEVSWYLLAEQTAQKSIAALPFYNSSATLVLAQVAQARHDFANTKKIAQSVLKTEPNNDEAKVILVTCALATGQLQEAQTLVQQMVKQMPNMGTLTLQALVEDAQGQPEAVKTFQLAMQAEEAGEVGGSALVRVLLGRHFYNRGDLTQATTLYQEALRILPRYPLALMHFAALETRRGNYKEADLYYDQVIAYSQQAANVYDHTVLRGKARLQKLQDQSDSELLQQAEKLLREDTNAGHENGAFGHRRELAQLLLDRNQNQDAKEALALMQDEVKIRRDAQTLAVLARAFMVNERLPEAQSTIRSALQTGVQNAGMFLQASQIEQKLGNPEPAKTYQSQAQKIDPSFDESAQLVMGLDTL